MYKYDSKNRSMCSREEVNIKVQGLDWPSPYGGAGLFCHRITSSKLSTKQKIYTMSFEMSTTVRPQESGSSSTSSSNRTVFFSTVSRCSTNMATSIRKRIRSIES